ncbi:MAG: chorismate pyruvate-lyase family protein [Pseudomonadota bacterium]|nr:chorismate pyruvate-lyase family protein [Pseudomonadota bacterium]
MTDLTMSLFNTQGFLPQGTKADDRFAGIDFPTLPPILRVLLVTDGTVTKTLEAYFWEPVRVQVAWQRVLEPTEQPADVIDVLGVQPGAPLWLRDVRLTGRTSGRSYALASSYLAVDSIPVALKNALLARQLGIGELLRGDGLETCREILTMGSSVQITHSALNADDIGPWVHRTYVIRHSGHRIMQIREHFPLPLYVGVEGQPMR